VAGVVYFKSSFSVPPFPSEPAFMQLRSSTQLRLPGERAANWTTFIISEVSLGLVFVVSIAFYVYCRFSDAEWVAIPGLLSLLAAVATGFGIFFTALGFGIMYYFAHNYFVQRHFHASRSLDYGQFVAAFGTLHEQSVRNFES
jgi:hypothetical protein